MAHRLDGPVIHRIFPAGAHGPEYPRRLRRARSDIARAKIPMAYTHIGTPTNANGAQLSASSVESAYLA